MIRHIVALRFSSEISETERSGIYDALRGLCDHVEGVLDFRTFRNVSPEEPVVHGFLDAFWFDFRDAAVRNAYLVHPAHQAVGARIIAATDGGPKGVFVLDVEL
jgi:hypothetical protein